jgi:processive 1,2-diacylglycerol beta-glucosyltransferase
MRALILSISKGSGHQHAAKAIEDAFHQNHPTVETSNHNFFDLVTNPLVEKMVSGTYLWILQFMPKFWGYLYDNEKVFKRTTWLRRLGSWKSKKKFIKYLKEITPDVIVCTQALPCEVTATLKRQKRFNIPLVAVVTDFVAHAYWVHAEVDLYIVPSKKTKEGLVNHGISPAKIKVLGIPINATFETAMPEQEKKAIIKKIGLDETLPIIMLMGGCQGFIPMSRMVKLIHQCKNPCQIIAVTGLNNKMRRKLNKSKVQSLKSKVQRLGETPSHKIANNPLVVYGYVNNIHELMSASDLLITKPGGMTSSEALVKQLPMIIIHSLPGQEEKNSRFLADAGVVVRLKSEKEIAPTIDRLLSNRILLSEFQHKMDELVIHHSAQKIVDEVMVMLPGAEEKELAYV